jgi:hypothetical protein
LAWKVCGVIKKVLFSAYQVGMFFLDYVNGEAKFRPRIVKFGWPGTPWQGKFLVIGSMQVEETMLFTQVGDLLCNLSECPQRVFFQRLSEGQDLESDFYFSANKRALEESEFSLWLETRRELLEKFDALDSGFSPVVVRSSRKKFIVEDGAHRLSLKSLRGIRTHRVEISVWYLG